MGETPLQLATRLRDEAARAGLRRMGEISIRVARGGFSGSRHFGACTDDGLQITFATKLADEPPDIINGVVAHELGHAADFLYPARWEYAHAYLKQGEKMKWGPRAGMALYDKRREYRGWQERSDDVVERMADEIAEAMFGTKIYYRGPCLVQSTAAGIRPRPRGLR